MLVLATKSETTKKSSLALNLAVKSRTRNFQKKKTNRRGSQNTKEEAIPTNMPPSPVTTATHIATIFGTVARGRRGALLWRQTVAGRDF